MRAATRIGLLAVLALLASLLGVPTALAAPGDTVVLASGDSGTPTEPQPITRTAAGLVYTEPVSGGSVWVKPPGGTPVHEDGISFATVLGELISTQNYTDNSLTWRTIADPTLHTTVIPGELTYLSRTPTGYLARRGSGPYEIVKVGLSPAAAPAVIGSTTAEIYSLTGGLTGAIEQYSDSGQRRYFPYDGSGERTITAAGGSSCVASGPYAFCWPWNGDPGLTRIPLAGGANATANLVVGSVVDMPGGVAFFGADGSATSLYTWANNAAAPVVRLDGSAQLTGPLASTTDGSGALLAVRHGAVGQAGIVAIPATGPPSLVLAAPAQPRTATEMAIGPGAVSWADNNTPDGSVWTRDLTTGSSALSAGSERLVASAASGSTLSLSGDRFTYTAGRSRFSPSALKDGATSTVLNDSSIQSTLSGDRLLFQSRVMGDSEVSRPWVLRDLGTGHDTALPDAVSYDLWGERLARLEEDGSVWVSNLRTGAAAVKVRNASPADSLWGSVHIAGDELVWIITSGTGTGNDMTYTTEVKRLNVQNPAAVSDLDGIRNIVTDLSTGYVTGVDCEPNAACTDVAVSLASGVSAPIDMYWRSQRPVVDGNVLAYVDADGHPTVKELPTYADQPRLLAAPGAGTALTIGGDPWSLRVVSSRVLTACTVEVRDESNAVVRSLPCTSAHAAKTVQWDGSNDAGAAVPDGTYTWRIAGATGPAALVDYDGTAGALTGTLTVSGSSAGGPNVTAQGPADHAVSLPVTTNVAAIFSEAVTGVSGTTFQLRTPAGTVIPAAVSYDAGRRLAMLNPTANLTTDTTYTATLTGGPSAIRNAANVPLATTTWSFTTGPAPTVTARGPAANGMAVPVGTNVAVRFSEPVVNLDATTYYLVAPVGPTGTAVPAALTYDPATRTATLNPTANLTPDTRYRVLLVGGLSGIRDAAGNPLTSASWYFTTGPAPTVTGRTPANGATNVARGSNVTATFSEPIQGLSRTTAVISNPWGTRQSAGIHWNAATRTVTLDPQYTLAPRTRYVVTLVGGASGIRDRAGNPLATYRWAFTTGTR